MERYESKFQEAYLPDDAHIYAELSSGKGAVPFGHLNKGDKFTYDEKGSDGNVQPRTDDVYIKLKGTWFKDTKTGQKYKTGIKTAVMPLD